MVRLNAKLRDHIVELRESDTTYPNVLTDFPVTIDAIFEVLRNIGVSKL